MTQQVDESEINEQVDLTHNDYRLINIKANSCMLMSNDYITCEDFVTTNAYANGYKNIIEGQTQHSAKSQLEDILEKLPINNSSFYNHNDNNNSSFMTCKKDDTRSYNKQTIGSESMLSKSRPIIIETTPKFKRVCVFCGSRSGNKSIYSEASLELANELVNRNMGLVYGGGNVGLMGLISKVVHQGGCHVIGVIPKAMTPREICGDIVAWGEVHVVDNMHERKAEMTQLADAFVALPGGYGTLEELMEIITCSQLGINNKPVGLLNVNGYYNSLLNLFDNFVEEGFISDDARKIIVSATTGKELLLKMEEYTPFYNSCGQYWS